MSVKAPYLTEIAYAYGDQIATSWIELYLETINLFASQADKATFTETAVLILALYPNLKATDIILFVALFKAGKYEQFYRAVDPSAVLRSLKQYTQERNKLVATTLQREAERRAEEEKAREELSKREAFLQYLSEQGMTEADWESETSEERLARIQKYRKTNKSP